MVDMGSWPKSQVIELFKGSPALKEKFWEKN
jgi:hypothetical protein